MAALQREGDAGQGIGLAAQWLARQVLDQWAILFTRLL